MANQRDREKLWTIIKKKKTKSDFFEISGIVSEIEAMIEEARLSGICDAIESLQGAESFPEAVAQIRKAHGMQL